MSKLNDFEVGWDCRVASLLAMTEEDFTLTPPSPLKGEGEEGWIPAFAGMTKLD